MSRETVRDINDSLDREAADALLPVAIKIAVAVRVVRAFIWHPVRTWRALFGARTGREWCVTE